MDGCFILKKAAKLNKYFREEIPKSGLLDQVKAIYISNCTCLVKSKYALKFLNVVQLKADDFNADDINESLRLIASHNTENPERKILIDFYMDQMEMRNAVKSLFSEGLDEKL